MRVLIDTNLWVDFLREPIPVVRKLLCEDRVSTHSCILGELLVGNLAKRELIREFLFELPRVPEAEPEEVLTMVERRRLWGRGLQWGDVQLLAAARLGRVGLWTRDRRLARAAEELNAGWEPR